MYEVFNREQLIWKIRELKDEIEKLRKENRRLFLDNESMKFKIEVELEPRIRAERRTYDAFIKNAEVARR